MSIYRAYSWHQVLLRRIGAISLGVIALPVMLFRRDRARFYSYLYKVWRKTSDKPVWLERSEMTLETRNR
ncbi:YbfA family protein [Xenorhabdus griffiniae]|uniref:YbfA family protein n=1 Tax=Xenorhabdus griffiniae TaxID=351672 RepID=A0ABY9XE73_9GAMM|nr:YbfA family protein [Xenorhabdus griffiniae]MBD1226131.1 YbfA family protein [Xenorhabdus griffiniae]MBE8585992.1 YbfA family protein [Xenorhabdus griffiniae]WMV71184.1 YbfA family protein [Xenorhabdus griffiniae]WNH00860.1 YbfA family protein [Xenorhabdus griffiniae]